MIDGSSEASATIGSSATATLAGLEVFFGLLVLSGVPSTTTAGASTIGDSSCFFGDFVLEFSDFFFDFEGVITGVTTTGGGVTAGAVLAFTTLDFVAVAFFDCFGAGSDATTSAGAITASGLIVSDLVLVVDFVCFFAGLADSLEVGKLAVSIGSEFSVGEANFFRGMAFGLRQVWPNWSAHRRFQR